MAAVTVARAGAVGACEPSRRRSGTAALRVGLVVANLTAGLMTLASLSMRWKRRGNGSTFSALELASTLTTGPTALRGGRLLAVVVYGVGTIGFGVIALAGARRRRWLLLRLTLGVLLLALLTVLVWRGWLPLRQWNQGPRVVFGASLLVLASTGCGLVLEKR